jgi:hypothetical protein
MLKPVKHTATGNIERLGSSDLTYYQSTTAPRKPLIGDDSDRLRAG